MFFERRTYRRGMLPLAAFLSVLAASAATFVIGITGVTLALMVLSLGFGFVIALGYVEVSLDATRIQVRHVPGFTRFIPLDDVLNVKISFDDSAWLIFGGWNPRHSPFSKELTAIGHNQAVGNRAVVLDLADGSTYWVGTWRPEDLARSIWMSRKA
jgi:hypothetical protein